MPVLTASRVKERLNDFSGGQNSGSDTHTLLPNQCELIENSIITQKGKTLQRLGISRLGDNPSTLVAHWTFDASSSVDDVGSLDATDTSVTYVAGKFGKAASFNATTSSMLVTTSTVIDVNSMGPFMIQAWVYVDSDGENDEGRIVDKMGATDAGYRLFVKSQSGSTVIIDFEVGDTGANTRVVTSTTMSTGAWHRINAIYNSDRSGDVYIDGVIASYTTDTTGATATANDSANNLYIGNRAAGDRCFDGEIDDVRIYDGAFTVNDVEMDSIKGLFHVDITGSIDTLLRVKDQAIQRLSADFTTWTDVSGATSQTADTTTNFVQAKNLVFVFNGVDNVLSLNGSLAVTDEGDTNADPPKGTVGEWATNNRLFVAGLTAAATKDIVYFSDSQDPQTFARSTNQFVVRSGDSATITWLKMFKEFELIVYKNDSIFVLDMDGATPLTDWTLKPLSVAVGCPAGRTVQDVGNDHIFLATDGVRLLSRTTFDKLRVGVISEPIQDIIDDINQDSIQNSVGWFENSLYLLGVPVGTSTIPNRWMIWDSIAARRNGDPNSAWTTVPTDTWNMSCLSSFGFGDNKRTIVGGDGRALTLCFRVLSGNTDIGAAIVQTIITREIDFGDSFAAKSFDPTYVLANPLGPVTSNTSGTYAISISIDRNTFSQFMTLTADALLQTPFSTPQTTVAGSEFEESTYRTKYIGKGKSSRVKVVNSVYNSQPEFHELTMYGRPYIGRV